MMPGSLPQMLCPHVKQVSSEFPYQGITRGKQTLPEAHWLDVLRSFYTEVRTVDRLFVGIKLATIRIANARKAEATKGK